MFTNGTSRWFGNVIMQWNNGLIAIDHVLILRMTTFLPSRGETLIFAEKAKELFFLHALTAILRLITLRPE